MKNNDTVIEKAKAMRFKKPLAKSMNWYQICEDLNDISSDCEDVRWMTEDDEQLIDLMDGDEEQAFEFKMAFTDLYTDVERMQDEINEIQRYSYMSGDDYDEEGAPLFDLFFPAVGMDDTYLGYDSYEQDYFPLDSYATDSARWAARKKLERLTKDQLLDLSGMALAIAKSYWGLTYRYDCLKASFDILRGENESLLRTVKAIEEEYDAWYEESEGGKWGYTKSGERLDKMLWEIPERLWIE